MNVFDIVIAVVLIFGFIRGLVKGFFVEIASLIALIGGVYGAIHFSDFVASYLKESLSWTEKQISLTAFALTFIAIVIVVSLAGKLLTKLADVAALGIVNKVSGGVFGLLKYALILSVFFLFFERINTSIGFVEEETLEESLLYKPLKGVIPAVFPSVNVDSQTLKTEDFNKLLDEI